MKDKLISAIIKTISDIIAVIIVFSNFSKFPAIITNFISKYITSNQKGILIIMTSLVVLLANLVFLVMQLIIYKFILKPVSLEVKICDASKKKIKKMEIKTPKRQDELLNVKTEIFIVINIKGGNIISNWIVKFLGSDIVFQYTPENFDMEKLNGWTANSNDSICLSKKGIVRYFWTDCININYNMEKDGIELSSGFIIKVKRDDLRKCTLEVKLCSTEKKWYLKRSLLFLFKRWLVSYNNTLLSIIIEQE